MKLYGVSDEYIAFIRDKYPRVYSNKEDVRLHTRKYLGAVIDINGYKYYIPLSSPKDKHDYVYINGERKIRNSSLIVVRIVEGEGDKQQLKGTLQIGTMIPVPECELIDYDANLEEDINYKNLVWSEIEFIRKNEKKIIKNASILYNKKARGSNEKIVEFCLDFKGVEKLCDEWVAKNDQSDNVLS